MKKETLANLSQLPDGGDRAGAAAPSRASAASPPGRRFQVERSLPHGHVEAVLDDGAPARAAPACSTGGPPGSATSVLAMICQRLLGARLEAGDARAFSQSTLGEELGVGEADEDELLRGDRLAAREAGADRAGARPPPPRGRHARPLRRLLLLLRGPHLPAGEARLLARRPPRQPADRVRAALRRRGPPGRGRGLRGLARTTTRRCRRRSRSSASASGSRAWSSSPTAAWSPRRTWSACAQRGHCLDHRAARRRR